MLQVNDLHIEIGPRFILGEASFLVAPGDKVGLVGRNGMGKSTLMSILSGEPHEAVAYTGTVKHSGTFSYLRQARLIAGQQSLTALQYVLAAKGFTQAEGHLQKRQAAMEADASDANVARFASAEESYRLMGGYQGESEARRVCAGLGLTDDQIDGKMENLSGGERRRAELGHALFADADVMLLDEPSNHLDVDAKTWLMTFLRSFRGGVLLVSHDIELLDTAITRVMHIDKGSLHPYKGTYTQYRKARAADVERRNKLAVMQKAEIHRIKSLADVMRHQSATRAKTAKALDKRVERLRTTQVGRAEKESGVRFRLPDPPQPGRLVLKVESLGMAYGRKGVFEDISFELSRADRMLVMGLNGAGKSSLLKALAGVLEPAAGGATPGMNVSIGYYAQEHEGLRPDEMVIDHLRSLTPYNDQEIRSLLGMFTLSGEIAFQTSGSLSGGEKTKLALAQLAAKQHNLLLLDEPTNNLDPVSREGITEALKQWKGTLLVVSHDTDFVKQLQPTQVLSMPEGGCTHWSDDLLDLVSLA
ncbi:MAG: ABC-F family ATP-binding cassette domain-containing protein [Actinomycetota bacterium]